MSAATRNPPLLELGRAGAPMLNFAHANGFPAGTYGVLLRRLARRFRVVAAPTRPTTPGTDPRRLRSWRELAQDLVAHARAEGWRDLVGVGHSVGGVATMMASVLDPDLFRAVVVLEPVLFTGRRSLLWGGMKALGLASRLHLVKGARRRGNGWASREEARAYFEGRTFFSGWDRACFADYLEHGLVERPAGGVELLYTPEWEARIFETTPAHAWRMVRKVSVPTLVLRGESSDTLLPEALARLRRSLRCGIVEEIPGSGHMLPLERPEQVAERIEAYVSGAP